MIEHPLVTVIAVCYNHARFVIECLDSIRNQTYPNVQLIIMDDCSHDDSVNIIRDWIGHYGIECTFIAHQKNQGLCRTLNEALSYAEGVYVSMIATDDMWMPNKLEYQVALMEELPPSVGVLYSDAYQIDELGEPLSKQFIEEHSSVPFYGSGDIFSRLVRGNFIPAMTTLIRRKCYERVGNYDTSLGYEDWDMWLRIARYYEFVFSPFVSAYYRIVTTSLARTAISSTSPIQHKNNIRIQSKVLRTLLPSEWDERLAIHDRIFSDAKWLYSHDVEQNHIDLIHASIASKSPILAAYALLSVLGVKYPHIARLTNFRKRVSSYLKWRMSFLKRIRWICEGQPLTREKRKNNLLANKPVEGEIVEKSKNSSS